MVDKVESVVDVNGTLNAVVFGSSRVVHVGGVEDRVDQEVVTDDATISGVK